MSQGPYHQRLYHIALRAAWERAQEEGIYRTGTLASDGFIHCSTREQVVRVANSVYTGLTGLLLLVINHEALLAPVKYEQPAPNVPERFPHIYGTLNLDAVERVLEFPPNADGTFTLPPEA